MEDKKNNIRPTEEKVLSKIAKEEKLHPKQLEIINDLYQSDLTEEQIAKKAGLTITTLRRLVREAKKNLLSPNED